MTEKYKFLISYHYNLHKLQGDVYGYGNKTIMSSSKFFDPHEGSHIEEIKKIIKSKNDNIKEYFEVILVILAVSRIK